MKKLIITAIAILASCATLTLSAQEQEKEKEMKTGWSFGILPTATFSADNGFQAGAFGDVYYYGDGSTYPDPLHKISWEASYFTKSHRMRLYLAYDSKYLIPGMRINASITYMNDPLYSFWGFNGPAAFDSGTPQSFTSVNYALWGNRALTPNINYFGMSRQMLRGLANVQGRITNNLNWAAGLNFWKWNLGDMRDNSEVKYDNDITLERITTMLRRRLEHPKVAEWFDGHWTLFNECTILSIEDGEVIERRPDRVMTDGTKWVVVDFKFGRPNPDYHDQVRQYMQLIEAMGHKNVQGFLWYVYSNIIEEVKA